jgi:glycosyltransferase involved in cell wall biosynthesis
MTARDYEIVHYGHEQSRVDCENVTVVNSNEVFPRGEDDLFEHNHSVAKIFCRRTHEELGRRYRTDDFILCFYGTDQQEAVTGITDAFVVEPSIGYRPECVFAPYRVFTSYAQMHYYYGQQKMLLTPSWNDAVIPNAFTPEEFDFSADKDDYYLYLGRISSDKGIHLAIQMTEYTGQRLVIAGPGDLSALNYASVPKHVTMAGYANVEQRRQLLSRARALIAPTYYVEPFGNMVVEALMSGTPVITTDWGGFIDTNPHGVTGFRCRNFAEFVQAIENTDQIRAETCRDWAVKNFSETVVHDKFDQYFTNIAARNFYHGTNL